jgi:hypothetical protein
MDQDTNFTMTAIAENTQEQTLSYQNKTYQLNKTNQTLFISIISILILIVILIGVKMYKYYSR